MSDGANISDRDLHAFLDGALDAGKTRLVASAIEADPALAARLAGYRADKDMIKRVYGPLADQPVPDHWLMLARNSKPAPMVSWRMVGLIAAVLVVALVAAFTWRSLQNPPAGSEIVQVALAARQDNAGQAIMVADKGATGRYDGALSAAISLRVKTPDLGKMGYRLTAIQLYPHASGGGAAQLLYRDRQNRLFTLYLRKSDGTARFDQFERAGLRVCIWQDDQLGLVMAGNVSTAAMQRLASLAYTGITL